MKKRIILLTLAAALVLSGCSRKKDSDGAITIAEQFGLAYAPLQIMKAKGFLEEIRPGTEVNWVRLGNTAAIREAVLAGDVDAGFLGIPPFLIARDQGMPWKIATGLSRSPLGLVVPEGKYGSLEDFAFDAKIALPQPGSIQHILLSMAAERSTGNAALLDHNLVSLKHPDGMNALLSGAVEGHFTSPPYIFQESDTEGFEVLLTGDDAMGGPYTFIVGMVTDEFHETSPGLYADYLKAVKKAVDYINTHREESVKILAEAYSLEEAVLADYLYRPGMVFETEIRGLDSFIEFMTGAGYLMKSVNPEEVIFDHPEGGSRQIYPDAVDRGLLALWEALYRLKAFHPLILPSLTEVLTRTWTDTLSGDLPLSILYSLLMIAAAFVPAVIAAFLMALAALRFPRAERFLETLSALAHPLPGIALLPLLILWTGLGNHIIVLIVIHSVLWPFYVNLRSGFREVPDLWLDLGRNNQLRGREVFFQILLPGAYPSCLAGLKIGWARAWRAVISAEMIFGTIGNAGGLGWYIFNKRIFMDTPGMYGGILILMAIGLLVDDRLFQWMERRSSLRWGGNG